MEHTVVCRELRYNEFSFTFPKSFQEASLVSWSSTEGEDRIRKLAVPISALLGVEVAETLFFGFEILA